MKTTLFLFAIILTSHCLAQLKLKRSQNNRTSELHDSTSGTIDFSNVTTCPKAGEFLSGQEVTIGITTDVHRVYAHEPLSWIDINQPIVAHNQKDVINIKAECRINQDGQTVVDCNDASVDAQKFCVYELAESFSINNISFSEIALRQRYQCDSAIPVNSTQAIGFICN
jgi:hypothetical protein